LNAPAGGVAPAAAAAGSPCLLINPSSFRASRRNLAARAARLAGQAGVEVFTLRSFVDLQPQLQRLRAMRCSQLWVLAGDGTLQAIAEWLRDLPAGDWSPALLPLAGGRANIVPRECGGYPALPALRRALAVWRDGRSLPEAQIVTLSVRQGEAPARLGFLLAGGVIHHGVRLCAEHRARGRGWLHRSWFADPYTLLKLAVQVWTGRSPLPPYERLEVQLAGGQRLHAPTRILLASTLRLERALYNPFAARGEGVVRVTAVAAAAQCFWRRLPALLGGRFDDSMDVGQGYLSGRCPAARVLGVTGYALDGEAFTADPSLPLELSPGIALRVLHA